MRRTSTRIAKKMVVTLLLFLIGSYLILCGVLYTLQEHLIFYPEVIPAQWTYTFPGRFDEVTWHVPGATLHGLHFKVRQPKGVILYFHGNAGSLRSWGSVAADLTAHGYDVLMPDYRGYGKSTGRITSEQVLHDDAAVVYTYLLQHYDEQQIIVYGRSIGTGLAVNMARSRQPRMLILETPYFNLTELATSQFPFVPRFLLKYPLRTDQWIGEVACPIYLYHGTEDDVIPYSSSVRLLPLIKTEHQLFTIEGAGHNTLRAFRSYHEHLATILE